MHGDPDHRRCRLSRRLDREATCSKEHKIRIFDRSDDRRLVDAIVGEASRGVEFRTGTLQAADVYAAAEGCDSIAHLAALLTPACQADPIRGANVNVNGTLNVFEAARKLGLESRRLRQQRWRVRPGRRRPSDADHALRRLQAGLRRHRARVRASIMGSRASASARSWSTGRAARSARRPG